MKINVQVFHHFSEETSHLARKLDILIAQGEQTMATQAELEAALTKVSQKLMEASNEITAELEKLRDEIAIGGNSTPGTDAALERVTELAEALADVVPNVEP